MSNRFHNKWHRHNHHTYPAPNEPDSSHDPIASPADPFKGDFVLAGALSASAPLSAFAGYFSSNNTALCAIGGNTGIYAYGSTYGIHAKGISNNEGNIRIDDFGNSNISFPAMSNPAIYAEGNVLFKNALSANSIWVTNLYAVSSVLETTDMHLTELSGFRVKGTDYGTSIPTTFNPTTQQGVTLDGVGVTGSSWASFGGDLKTSGDLHVGGTAHIGDGLSITGGVTATDGLSIAGDISASGNIYGYTNTNPMPANYPDPNVVLIGGGTTFQNKSIQEIFDLLLYPQLFPTFTNPVASLASISTPQEIGAVVTISLNASFNRGLIIPDYNGTFPYSNAPRSGLPVSYTYSGPSANTTPQNSTSLTNTQTINNYQIAVDSQTWSVTVQYSEGSQPVDSKGNDYDSPLPAGSTSIVSRTVNGVYPVYATTSSITTLTKQPIVNKNTSPYTVSLVSEDSNNRHTVEFPGNWSNVTGIKYYNPINQAFEFFGGSAALSLTFWEKTDITRNTTYASNVSYERWTYNYTDSPVGARQIQFIR